jgi:PST family polysaccharide transporter
VFTFGLIGVSDSVMGTAWTLLDKTLRLGRASAISTIAFVISYVPAFWLALHHGSYWSLVAQNAAYSLLLVGSLWWAARRTVPGVWTMRWRFDRVLARDLLRIGIPIGATSMTGLLVTQLDNFFVGTLVGVAALGLYTRAYNLAQWPSRLVTNVISQAAFYAYARLQDDRARLERTVTMSLWLITTLALPVALGIFAAAPDLVRLLYGPRWAESAIYLRFLVIYSALGPLLSDAGWLFIAVGRPRLTFRVSLAQVVTLAIVGLGLTLRFGVVGTCFAVGATFLVGLVLTYRYVFQVITLPIWSSLGVPAIAAVATLAGYLLGVRLLDPAHWPLTVAVLAKLLYATSAYIGVLFVLQPRATRERTAYVFRLARLRKGRVA